ncbi:MAG: DUF2283 domain-containing protein, partial [Candidatus Micrarchaeota archaeon]
LYVAVSSKKAFVSLEVSPRIVLDLSHSKNVVGVEVLDASKVLSEVFGFPVSKADLGRLNCKINEGDALYLHFELNDKSSSLALPKNYSSPLLSASSS